MYTTMYVAFAASLLLYLQIINEARCDLQLALNEWDKFMSNEINSPPTVELDSAYHELTASFSDTDISGTGKQKRRSTNMNMRYLARLRVARTYTIKDVSLLDITDEKVSEINTNVGDGLQSIQATDSIISGANEKQKMKLRKKEEHTLGAIHIKLYYQEKYKNKLKALRKKRNDKREAASLRLSRDDLHRKRKKHRARDELGDKVLAKYESKLLEKMKRAKKKFELKAVKLQFGNQMYRIEKKKMSKEYKLERKSQTKLNKLEKKERKIKEKEQLKENRRSIKLERKDKKTEHKIKKKLQRAEKLENKSSLSIIRQQHGYNAYKVEKAALKKKQAMNTRRGVLEAKFLKKHLEYMNKIQQHKKQIKLETQLTKIEKNKKKLERLGVEMVPSECERKLTDDLESLCSDISSESSGKPVMHDVSDISHDISYTYVPVIEKTKNLRKAKRKSILIDKMKKDIVCEEKRQLLLEEKKRHKMFLSIIEPDEELAEIFVSDIEDESTKEENKLNLEHVSSFIEQYCTHVTDDMPSIDPPEKSSNSEGSIDTASSATSLSSMHLTLMYDPEASKDDMPMKKKKEEKKKLKRKKEKKKKTKKNASSDKTKTLMYGDESSDSSSNDSSGTTDDNSTSTSESTMASLESDNATNSDDTTGSLNTTCDSDIPQQKRNKATHKNMKRTKTSTAPPNSSDTSCSSVPKSDSVSECDLLLGGKNQKGKKSDQRSSHKKATAVSTTSSASNVSSDTGAESKSEATDTKSDDLHTGTSESSDSDIVTCATMKKPMHMHNTKSVISDVSSEETSDSDIVTGIMNKQDTPGSNITTRTKGKLQTKHKVPQTKEQRAPMDQIDTTSVISDVSSEETSDSDIVTGIMNKQDTSGSSNIAARTKGKSQTKHIVPQTKEQRAPIAENISDMGSLTKLYAEFVEPNSSNKAHSGGRSSSDNVSDIGNLSHLCEEFGINEASTDSTSSNKARDMVRDLNVLSQLLYDAGITHSPDTSLNEITIDDDLQALAKSIQGKMKKIICYPNTTASNKTKLSISDIDPESLSKLYTEYGISTESDITKDDKDDHPMNDINDVSKKLYTEKSQQSDNIVRKDSGQDNDAVDMESLSKLLNELDADKLHIANPTSSDEGNLSDVLQEFKNSIKPVYREKSNETSTNANATEGDEKKNTVVDINAENISSIAEFNSDKLSAMDTFQSKIHCEDMDQLKPTGYDISINDTSAISLDRKPNKIAPNVALLLDKGKSDTESLYDTQDLNVWDDTMQRGQTNDDGSVDASQRNLYVDDDACLPSPRRDLASAVYSDGTPVCFTPPTTPKPFCEDTDRTIIIENGILTSAETLADRKSSQITSNVVLLLDTGKSDTESLYDTQDLNVWDDTMHTGQTIDHNHMVTTQSLDASQTNLYVDDDAYLSSPRRDLSSAVYSDGTVVCFSPPNTPTPFCEDTDGTIIIDGDMPVPTGIIGASKYASNIAVILDQGRSDTESMYDTQDLKENKLHDVNEVQAIGRRAVYDNQYDLNSTNASQTNLYVDMEDNLPSPGRETVPPVYSDGTLVFFSPPSSPEPVCETTGGEVSCDDTISGKNTSLMPMGTMADKDETFIVSSNDDVPEKNISDMTHPTTDNRYEPCMAILLDDDFNDTESMYDINDLNICNDNQAAQSDSDDDGDTQYLTKQPIVTLGSIDQSHTNMYLGMDNLDEDNSTSPDTYPIQALYSDGTPVRFCPPPGMTSEKVEYGYKSVIVPDFFDTSDLNQETDGEENRCDSNSFLVGSIIQARDDSINNLYHNSDQNEVSPRMSEEQALYTDGTPVCFINPLTDKIGDIINCAGHDVIVPNFFDVSDLYNPNSSDHSMDGGINAGIEENLMSSDTSNMNVCVDFGNNALSTGRHTIAAVYSDGTAVRFTSSVISMCSTDKQFGIDESDGEYKNQPGVIHTIDDNSGIYRTASQYTIDLDRKHGSELSTNMSKLDHCFLKGLMSELTISTETEDNGSLTNNIIHNDTHPAKVCHRDSMQHGSLVEVSDPVDFQLDQQLSLHDSAASVVLRTKCYSDGQMDVIQHGASDGNMDVMQSVASEGNMDVLQPDAYNVNMDVMQPSASDVNMDAMQPSAHDGNIDVMQPGALAVSRSFTKHLMTDNVDKSNVSDTNQDVNDSVLCSSNVSECKVKSAEGIHINDQCRSSDNIDGVSLENNECGQLERQEVENDEHYMQATGDVLSQKSEKVSPILEDRKINSLILNSQDAENATEHEKSTTPTGTSRMSGGKWHSIKQVTKKVFSVLSPFGTNTKETKPPNVQKESITQDFADELFDDPPIMMTNKSQMSKTHDDKQHKDGVRYRQQHKYDTIPDDEIDDTDVSKVGPSMTLGDNNLKGLIDDVLVDTNVIEQIVNDISNAIHASDQLLNVGNVANISMITNGLVSEVKQCRIGNEIQSNIDDNGSNDQSTVQFDMHSYGESIEEGVPMNATTIPHTANGGTKFNADTVKDMLHVDCGNISKDDDTSLHTIHGATIPVTATSDIISLTQNVFSSHAAEANIDAEQSACDAEVCQFTDKSRKSKVARKFGDIKHKAKKILSSVLPFGKRPKQSDNAKRHSVDDREDMFMPIKQEQCGMYQNSTPLKPTIIDPRKLDISEECTNELNDVILKGVTTVPNNETSPKDSLSALGELIDSNVIMVEKAQQDRILATEIDDDWFSPIAHDQYACDGFQLKKGAGMLEYDDNSSSCEESELDLHLQNDHDHNQQSNIITQLSYEMAHVKDDILDDDIEITEVCHITETHVTADAEWYKPRGTQETDATVGTTRESGKVSSVLSEQNNSHVLHAEPDLTVNNPNAWIAPSPGSNVVTESKEDTISRTTSGDQFDQHASVKPDKTTGGLKNIMSVQCLEKLPTMDSYTAPLPSYHIPQDVDTSDTDTCSDYKRNDITVEVKANDVNCTDSMPINGDMDVHMDEIIDWAAPVLSYDSDLQKKAVHDAQISAVLDDNWFAEVPAIAPISPTSDRVSLRPATKICDFVADNQMLQTHLSDSSNKTNDSFDRPSYSGHVTSQLDHGFLNELLDELTCDSNHEQSDMSSSTHNMKDNSLKFAEQNSEKQSKFSKGYIQENTDITDKASISDWVAPNIQEHMVHSSPSDVSDKICHIEDWVAPDLEYTNDLQLKAQEDSNVASVIDCDWIAPPHHTYQCNPLEEGQIELKKTSGAQHLDREVSPNRAIQSNTLHSSSVSYDKHATEGTPKIRKLSQAVIDLPFVKKARTVSRLDQNFLAELLTELDPRDEMAKQIQVDQKDETIRLNMASSDSQTTTTDSTSSISEVSDVPTAELNNGCVANVQSDPDVIPTEDKCKSTAPDIEDNMPEMESQTIPTETQHDIHPYNRYRLMEGNGQKYGSSAKKGKFISMPKMKALAGATASKIRDGSKKILSLSPRLPFRKKKATLEEEHMHLLEIEAAHLDRIFGSSLHGLDDRRTSTVNDDENDNGTDSGSTQDNKAHKYHAGNQKNNEVILPVVLSKETASTKDEVVKLQTDEIDEYDIRPFPDHAWTTGRLIGTKTSESQKNIAFENIVLDNMKQNSDACMPQSEQRNDTMLLLDRRDQSSSPVEQNSGIDKEQSVLDGQSFNPELSKSGVKDLLDCNGKLPNRDGQPSGLDKQYNVMDPASGAIPKTKNIKQLMKNSFKSVGKKDKPTHEKPTGNKVMWHKFISPFKKLHKKEKPTAMHDEDWQSPMMTQGSSSSEQNRLNDNCNVDEGARRKTTKKKKLPFSFKLFKGKQSKGYEGLSRDDEMDSNWNTIEDWQAPLEKITSIDDRLSVSNNTSPHASEHTDGDSYSYPIDFEPQHATSSVNSGDGIVTTSCDNPSVYAPAVAPEPDPVPTSGRNRSSELDLQGIHGLSIGSTQGLALEPAQGLAIGSAPIHAPPPEQSSHRVIQVQEDEEANDRRFKLWMAQNLSFYR